MIAKRPRIFLDADVIFAGSASSSVHGASYVVLLMGEITLIDCITSEQVITEVERNLASKLPNVLPEFRLLIKRCLQVAPDPAPELIEAHLGQADPKDLPILVAAIRENCSYLLTFNTRHYTPTSSRLVVQPPGEFLKVVRNQLSFLSGAEDWASPPKIP